MNIFSVISICGGLAFFLFGMHVMSTSLEKIAGGKLEATLKKMTSNPIKSLLLGCGITIAIQSSSAMTVMLVGLVNSGIMDLSQTVGVIMGSNIGTTLTAWILSLTGIQSDNFFVSMLKPANFTPILALIGVIMIMVCKSHKKKDIGTIFVGFSVLMYGMVIMEEAVEPLSTMPEFENLLTAFNNPLLGVLIGAVFTGIIQSSAASVGILQALSLTGSVTYGMAIPIIMGQNIGTCVTALLSSIGVNKNAKRVAVVHVSFNLIGTAVCLVIYYIVQAFFDLRLLEQPINPVGIACFHSIFNIATTLILLPFTDMLVKIASFVVRDKNSQEKTVLLDDRLLLSPHLAVDQCRTRTVEMAEIAKKAINEATGLISVYDQNKADDVIVLEQTLDKMEDELGTFMVKLSSKELADEDSNEISVLLHTITDFERIGDHAINITETVDKINKKNLEFSMAAKRELETLVAALTEILELSVKCFVDNDIKLAGLVEPLEEVIDDLTAEIKNRHIERLRNGECSAELGILLVDTLTNVERVSDHCSNVAVCIIQISKSTLDNHDYLHELKSDHDVDFEKELAKYRGKYRLDNLSICSYNINYANK